MEKRKTEYTNLKKLLLEALFKRKVSSSNDDGGGQEDEIVLEKAIKTQTPKKLLAEESKDKGTEAPPPLQGIDLSAFLQTQDDNKKKYRYSNIEDCIVDAYRMHKAYKSNPTHHHEKSYDDGMEL